MLCLYRDHAPHYLNQIVQQQAQSELEDRPFRSRAHQVRESENLDDLLEHSFDSPAIQVDLQQVHCWERSSVT